MTLGRVLGIASNAAALLLVAATAAAVDVPLTVRETAGVDRKQALCRTGIPLPPNAATDTSDLSIIDLGGRPVPCQFRVMNRRRTGDIEWVCVTFLADVPADQTATYRLTDGRSAKATLATPVKIITTGAVLTVSTGPLQVKIPTDSFSGLGAVSLDMDGNGRFEAPERVATGGALVIEGVDGKTYRSTDDLTAPLRVTVEEAGPVHSVVRIDGQMKAQSHDGEQHTYPNYGRNGENNGKLTLPNQDQSLGFTIRYHFWSGSPQVRAFVTMRNLRGVGSSGTDKKTYFASYYASTIQRPGNFLVDAVNLELDLVASADMRYRIGGHDTVHTGTLAGGSDSVILYQDSSAGWMWQAGLKRIFDPVLVKNDAWMKAHNNDKAYFEYEPFVFKLLTERDGYSFMGYRVYGNATPVTPGSDTSHASLGEPMSDGMRAQGWIEAGSGGAAVTVGLRWLWQMCPKDLTATGAGKLSVGLWSQHWPRGHVWEGRVHRTHELMYDFRPRPGRVDADKRFAAFDQRLVAVVGAVDNLRSRAYGDFMLPNPEDSPLFEASALSAVVNGIDPELFPGLDSSMETEREKYDQYGVWKFGDHSKGGWHYFSQYMELDVPYCLMVHFARTGDLRFYREAEGAVRQLLDIAAHGGGYGHQAGESSHYYTTGPLMFAYVTGEPWLKEAIQVSHDEHAKPNPWHARSYGMTMWSNLDMLHHFPEGAGRYRKGVDIALAWWDKVQDKATGKLGGYDRSWQTFMLGISGDAMGQYCEAFPDDAAARAKLVSACREWRDYARGLSGDAKKKAVNHTVANAFAYAARFSGDASLLDFVGEYCLGPTPHSANYRTGTSSAKAWSEYGHRLIQVYMHDVDRRRHPDRYTGLP